MMITREPIKRGPFLTGVTNELPFVLANGAGDWRSCGLVKLGSALDADEIFHGGLDFCSGDLRSSQTVRFLHFAAAGVAPAFL
jgi:hypothetical protein